MTGSKLLFKSGFGAGVSVGAPFVSGGQWNQRLVGGDVAGLAWPPNARLEYQVSAGAVLGDHVESRIETVDGGGALKLAVVKDDPATPNQVRNAYTVFQPNPSTDLLKSLHVRYRVKFQPDLEAIMPLRGWRSFMEWREENDNYRFLPMVERVPGRTNLVWHIKAQIGDHGPNPWEDGKNIDWEHYSDAIPVPVGQWFLLEVYWNHSTDSDGRVIVRVNGTQIFDHQGRNKISNRLRLWDMLKVYTGQESLAIGPAYQWVTDCEVYRVP